MNIQLDDEIVALVDASDYDLVSSSGPWYAVAIGNMIYARNADRQYMHKLITGYELTDHKNRNGLDNRRANLREATKAQNGQNMGLRSNNTTGYKGVSWDKSVDLFVARVNVGSKCHKTHHHSAIEAAESYDRMAEEHFGEFARTNKKLGLLLCSTEDGEGRLRLSSACLSSSSTGWYTWPTSASS